MANEPIVTIIGNLTGDPELRYVSSGTPVSSFTVASTPRSTQRHHTRTTPRKEGKQWLVAMPRCT